MTVSPRRPGRWERIGAIVFLAFTVTLLLQRYVGGTTIYAESHEEQRAAVHEAILRNAPAPERSWTEIGGSVNTRVATVYLAESLRRATGLSLMKSYALIETAALFAALLALFAFLMNGSGSQLALVGLLYVAAVQPLSYAFQYFQPWDRPSLLCWILVTWCIRRDRPLWAAALLPLAVLIKWDIVVLPGLYVFAYARKDNMIRVARAVATMGICAVGTYLVLRWWLPAGPTPTLTPVNASAIVPNMVANLRDAAELGLFYPPMLGLLLPALLAIVGWRHGSRFEIASFAFGAAVLVPLFMLTHFREIRAEMPALFLMLPLGLRGVESLIPRSRQSAADSTVARP